MKITLITTQSDMARQKNVMKKKEDRGKGGTKVPALLPNED